MSLKELEMYQDNGMFKEHDELVKEKIRHYEEREAPTMVWVLKIEQSATYSYQDNWEQAWEQLVSVINSGPYGRIFGCHQSKSLVLTCGSHEKRQRIQKVKIRPVVLVKSS